MQALAGADINHFGCEGETAISPTEPVGAASKIGFHVRPIVIGFPTPPLFTPM